MDKQSIPKIINKLNSTIAGVDIMGNDVQYIQDVGIKFKGWIYIDRNTTHSYLCLENTESTDNNNSYYRACSINDITTSLIRNTAQKEYKFEPNIWQGDDSWQTRGYIIIKTGLNVKNGNFFRVDANIYVYGSSRSFKLYLDGYCYSDTITSGNGIIVGSKSGTTGSMYLIDTDGNLSILINVTNLYYIISQVSIVTYSGSIDLNVASRMEAFKGSYTKPDNIKTLDILFRD